VRALITGSAGFVAGYLEASLVADGHHVQGLDHHEGRDIRDYEVVRRAVLEANPDWIFHLAAVSTPKESLSDPRRSMEVNVTGTLNLLEAVRNTGFECKILVAGSADEYGNDAGVRVTEESPCFPSGPYGVSKLAATSLAMTYASRYGMPVVATRAWNHIGPGRRSVSVASGFARRIVSAERGETSVVLHGPLGVEIDFIDVNDVVRAYRQVIDLPPGIWNVCSEKQVSLDAVLLMLLDASKVPDAATQQDPRFGDPKRRFAVGSCAKLRDATGWKPEIPLEQTLREILDFWREQ